MFPLDSGKGGSYTNYIRECAAQINESFLFLVFFFCVCFFFVFFCFVFLFVCLCGFVCGGEGGGVHEMGLLHRGKPIRHGFVLKFWVFAIQNFYIK